MVVVGICPLNGRGWAVVLEEEETEDDEAPDH